MILIVSWVMVGLSVSKRSLVSVDEIVFKKAKRIVVLIGEDLLSTTENPFAKRWSSI